MTQSNDILNKASTLRCSRQRVEQLIREGADVNARDKDGRTPLHIAVTHGGVDIIACLIRHGAQLDARDVEGETPLMTAQFWRGEVVTRQLIDAGADVNLADNEGRTALHKSRELKCVVALLEAGADWTIKDERGRTPEALALRQLDMMGEEGYARKAQYLAAVRRRGAIASLKTRNEAGAGEPESPGVPVL